MWEGTEILNNLSPKSFCLVVFANVHVWFHIEFRTTTNFLSSPETIISLKNTGKCGGRPVVTDHLSHARILALCYFFNLSITLWAVYYYCHHHHHHHYFINKEIEIQGDKGNFQGHVGSKWRRLIPAPKCDTVANLIYLLFLYNIKWEGVLVASIEKGKKT